MDPARTSRHAPPKVGPGRPATSMPGSRPRRMRNLRLRNPGGDIADAAGLASKRPASDCPNRGFAFSAGSFVKPASENSDSRHIVDDVLWRMCELATYFATAKAGVSPPQCVRAMSLAQCCVGVTRQRRHTDPALRKCSRPTRAASASPSEISEIPGDLRDIHRENGSRDDALNRFRKRNLQRLDLRKVRLLYSKIAIGFVLKPASRYWH